MTPKHSSYLYSCFSGVWIYSDICLVNMLHPNIFGYLFGTYCDIRIYLETHSCPFYDIHSSLVYNMSICLNNESMSIPWVNVCTRCLILYHESMYIPWVFVNKRPKIHEFRSSPRWSPIPMVKVSAWFPCQTFTDTGGKVVRALANL